MTVAAGATCLSTYTYYVVLQMHLNLHYTGKQTTASVRHIDELEHRAGVSTSDIWEDLSDPGAKDAALFNLAAHNETVLDDEAAQGRHNDELVLVTAAIRSRSAFESAIHLISDSNTVR